MSLADRRLCRALTAERGTDGRFSWQSAEIIQELNPRIAKGLNGWKCHIDPDLSNRFCEPPLEWKPAFGQQGASQVHLQRYGIGRGDVFLFYGWFRQTECAGGKLRFVAPAKDKTSDRHIIFGYMEVGEVLTDPVRIGEEFPYHPHACENTYPHNTLYIPADVLSLDPSRKGYGILRNAPVRQLTKEGHKRSEWEWPECFRKADVSYHKSSSLGWQGKDQYFRAACRGQEFVIETELTQEMKNWLRSVISE